MKIRIGLLASLLTLALCGSAWANTITIKGSTTVLPIMQLAVEGFMAENPGVRIDLSGGGSGEGIKAIIDSTTDLAMSSRSIRESEIDLAKTRGVTPKEFVVAKDAVAAIVHPSNKITNLTVDQLQGIFSGKITDWKDVGGDAGRIAVISRDSSSGTFETWQHFILQKERVSPTALMQASSGAVLQSVAGNRFAISYDGLGYVNDSIRALKVNDVMPTAATALDGSYPVSRDLYLYTNGEPTGVLKQFVDYLLGPKGKLFVKEAGFVPLP